MSASPEAIYQKQQISHPKRKQSVLLEAFTSAPFHDRVTAGIERVRAQQAESAFAVITDGETIVYSPFTPGTSAGHEVSDRTIGIGMPSTEKSLINLLLDLTIDGIRKPDGSVSYGPFSVLGEFHSHTPHKYYTGFSQADMENYDNLPTDLRNRGLTAHTEDRYNGVFLTKMSTDTTETVLFMFQGPPSNNFYQAVDFRRLNLERQKEVLNQSGMKTIVADIPYAESAADLSPLAVALRNT